MNPLLDLIQEDVMGFLNEVQLNYPEAISFASGRPDERYFDIDDNAENFDRYVDFAVRQGKGDRGFVLGSLGQYNKTKGFVNELVAAFLAKDENIDVGPEDILITVGSQEAMAIAVMTMCDKENDVIIVEDPSYVGITHFSLISGYCVEPVSVASDGICLSALEDRIIANTKAGKKVRLVYVIPDFQNPTGAYMLLSNRLQLLEMAVRYDFFILEDNAYGDFRYDGEALAPIKAIDTDRRVIYMRSFAKTLYPSLRIGALVADQIIGRGAGDTRLSDLMARTKGYLTVNTSSINQAILGGILLKNDFSLRQANAEKVISMKKKRDLMLDCMNRSIKGQPWGRGISWNIPSGGFFMTINLPFKVDKSEVVRCAELFKVIFTPMSFFYFREGGERQMRIAFSNLSMGQMDMAVLRLAEYFKSRLITNF